MQYSIKLKVINVSMNVCNLMRYFSNISTFLIRSITYMAYWWHLSFVIDLSWYKLSRNLLLQVYSLFKEIHRIKLINIKANKYQRAEKNSYCGRFIKTDSLVENNNWKFRNSIQFGIYFESLMIYFSFLD